MNLNMANAFQFLGTVLPLTSDSLFNLIPVFLGSRKFCLWRLPCFLITQSSELILYLCCPQPGNRYFSKESCSFECKITHYYWVGHFFSRPFSKDRAGCIFYFILEKRPHACNTKAELPGFTQPRWSSVCVSFLAGWKIPVSSSTDLMTHLR